MNLTELATFIEELNDELRRNKDKFHKNMTHYNLGDEVEYFNERKELTETELKVYIKISNYFRLCTITIPNITIAYEMWLKGILQILLREVGLNSENWDDICYIGDHNSSHIQQMDKEWPHFLEQIKQGNMNEEVWDLIQVGKKRSGELLKRRITRKRRSE